LGCFFVVGLCFWFFFFFLWGGSPPPPPPEKKGSRPFRGGPKNGPPGGGGAFFEEKEHVGEKSGAIEGDFHVWKKKGNESKDTTLVVILWGKKIKGGGFERKKNAAHQSKGDRGGGYERSVTD